MNLDQEAKKIAAQFCNALAVAIMATMVLAPLAAGQFHLISMVLAVCCTVILHATALLIARRS